MLGFQLNPPPRLVGKQMVRTCCANYHMPAIGTQSRESTKKRAANCLEKGMGMVWWGGGRGLSEKASWRR